VIGITAQVSLYPLHQESLSPAIDQALETFRAHGLHVEPGSMSTLIDGDDGAIFAALRDAFRLAAEQGQVVMVATVSNACPVPGKEGESVTYTSIGRVENDFDEPTAPEEIQSGESRIVVAPALTGGLKGLEPGRKMMIVYYFHRSEGYELCQHPRGDRSRPRRGVFALCSPRRPNPIGVAVVDLVAIDGNVLHVRGLDAINGTPVLDLKPA
jgi:tRNA-Thr(GGU) m(6)t(6)A37 methyltransferase TsaA